MSTARASETERLKASLEQRLSNGDLAGVDRLQRLADLSDPGSEGYLFAHKYLGDELIECDPWRAALSLRIVLKARPFDDFVWGRMGLAMTLLGHYRAAASAYRQALAICPGDPWYGHNLGHLLDIMLDHPDRALPLLVHAHGQVPDDPEIASSLAHCLARLGRLAEAHGVLSPFMTGLAYREHRLLYRWIVTKMASQAED